MVVLQVVYCLRPSSTNRDMALTTGSSSDNSRLPDSNTSGCAHARAPSPLWTDRPDASACGQAKRRKEERKHLTGEKGKRFDEDDGGWFAFLTTMGSGPSPSGPLDRLERVGIRTIVARAPEDPLSG